jgi:hypothetical protein
MSVYINVLFPSLQIFQNLRSPVIFAALAIPRQIDQGKLGVASFLSTDSICMEFLCSAELAGGVAHTLADQRVYKRAFACV